MDSGFGFGPAARTTRCSRAQALSCSSPASSSSPGTRRKPYRRLATRFRGLLLFPRGLFGVLWRVGWWRLVNSVWAAVEYRRSFWEAAAGDAEICGPWYRGSCRRRRPGARSSGVRLVLAAVCGLRAVDVGTQRTPAAACRFGWDDGLVRTRNGGFRADDLSGGEAAQPNGRCQTASQLADRWGACGDGVPGQEGVAEAIGCGGRAAGALGRVPGCCVET
jgi:hypothetical protein